MLIHCVVYIGFCFRFFGYFDNLFSQPAEWQQAELASQWAIVQELRLAVFRVLEQARTAKYGSCCEPVLMLSERSVLVSKRPSTSPWTAVRLSIDSLHRWLRANTRSSPPR